MNNKSEYIESLTPLRGIAALWIVVFHFNEFLRFMKLPTISFDEYTSLLSHAYVWVDFFFILSGFIITHVYAAKLCRPEPGAIKAYLWARFTRIYPLLLFSMLLMLAYILFLRYFYSEYAASLDEFFGARDFFAYLGFGVSFGFTSAYSWNLAAWSISAEWWAYVAAIGLIPLIHSRSNLLTGVVFIATLLGVYLIKVYGDKYGLDHALDTGLIRCVFEFSMGVAIYQVYLKIRGRQSQFSASWFFCGAALGSLAVAHFGGHPLLLLPFLSLLILSSAVNNGLPQLVLNLKPMRFLGDISYSIYLLHIFWLSVWASWFDLYWRAINPVRMPSMTELLLWLAVVLICVVGSSVVSYRLVEVAGRNKLRNIFFKI